VQFWGFGQLEVSPENGLVKQTLSVITNIRGSLASFLKIELCYCHDW